jgi:hypothetical protein
VNKIIPIGIVVGVAIVGLAIGGWYFFLRGGQAPLAPTQEEVSQEVQAPQEEGFTGRLKDALTLGRSMKCVWQQDENNFGTAYVKSEKVFTKVTVEGKKTNSIMADNCTYVWEEGKTDGFKMCYEPVAEEEVETGEIPETPSGEPPVSVGQTPDVNYTCEPAIVSDSMFNPPAGITFISPEELIRP